jgi:hypothetical protein
VTDEAHTALRSPDEQSGQPVGAGSVSFPSSSTTADGIFVGGLEAYRPVTEHEYHSLLTSGLIVLDTNALLDLYRYHAKTREDLIEVLTRLESRLWVPYHAMNEFFNNRPSVIESRAEEIDKVIQGLVKDRSSLESKIRGWANRLGLSQKRSTEIVEEIRSAVDRAVDAIRELSTDDASEYIEDMVKDPVITALSDILEGSVGGPLSADEMREVKKEAMQRIGDKRPPGWKDASKRANPEGDYIVWYETLKEAKRRGVDVLFVTGDVKEDWWIKERNEAKGPLPELAHEMRVVANVRLFMLRPESLLVHAGNVLGLSISEASVQDAQRVSARDDISWATSDDQETHLRLGAEELVQIVQELDEQERETTRTGESLAEPLIRLADAYSRFDVHSLIDAVWAVVDAAIGVGIFGGTGHWQPTSWEHDVWKALDALYMNAVSVWLDDTVYQFELEDAKQIVWPIVYDVPLPPGVGKFYAEFKKVSVSPGYQSVIFTAIVSDGREVTSEWDIPV